MSNTEWTSRWDVEISMLHWQKFFNELNCSSAELTRSTVCQKATSRNTSSSSMNSPQNTSVTAPSTSWCPPHTSSDCPPGPQVCVTLSWAALSGKALTYTHNLLGWHLSENHAWEGIVHKACDCVHQTGTWDILCDTEGLGKLQNKVPLREEMRSRLTNRERADNTLQATPVDPL